MRFDVHGVQVDVTGDAGLVARVERDFSLFTVPDGGGPPDVAIELAAEPFPPPEPSEWGRPVGRTKDAKVHRRGSRQFFDSGPPASVEYDFAKGRGRIAGAEPDLVHEKAYLLVMSRLGALLDRRGLHRVHAMGVERGGLAALALLPMGGGKTTLALSLLEHPGVSLLSEEVPLVSRNGTLLPFPIRIGVVAGTKVAAPERFVSPFRRSRHGPKTLIDARWLEGRVASSAAPGVLLVGRRTGDRQPEVRPLSTPAAWDALGRLCVLGLGLPQLLEYSAPWTPATAFTAAPVLLARLRACAALLRRCRAYELRLGTDSQANAELVLRLLDQAREAASDTRPGAGMAAEPTSSALPGGSR